MLILFCWENRSSQKRTSRTSLVIQWLRICLPTQGTQVPSLVWEDSTCPAATKPTCYNYWAQGQESKGREACPPQLEKDRAATKPRAAPKKGTYISSHHHIHPLTCVCPYPLAFLLLCSLRLCRFQPILLTPFKEICSQSFCLSIFPSQLGPLHHQQACCTFSH